VSDEDDEALTWAGGRDPSHYETPEPKAPKPSKRSKAASRTDDADTDASDAAPSDTDESPTEPTDDDLPPAMSSIMLVVLGIFGGVFALYTIGWFIGIQRLLYFALDPLEQLVFDAEEWLAVLAAPLWFVLALLLTRGRKPAIRLLWLLVGAIVLIPWPFVLGK
jgi:hypothetical protein